MADLWGTLRPAFLVLSGDLRLTNGTQSFVAHPARELRACLSFVNLPDTLISPGSGLDSRRVYGIARPSLVRRGTSEGASTNRERTRMNQAGDTQSQTRTVFLSYTSLDREAARAVIAGLRTAGVDVWWNEREHME